MTNVYSAFDFFFFFFFLKKKNLPYCLKLNNALEKNGIVTCNSSWFWKDFVVFKLLILAADL